MRWSIGDGYDPISGSRSMLLKCLIQSLPTTFIQLGGISANLEEIKDKFFLENKWVSMVHGPVDSLRFDAGKGFVLERENSQWWRRFRCRAKKYAGPPPAVIDCPLPENTT
ncbi:AAEL002664-PA [Aedes aegypti]|uniref:AAEL002664-PA n=1 Tax=Aedes aegypti TaxID=7159 RepID=Q17HI2_AEDAE|nr:AAEL002664-PA [Aedes aegypti]